MKEKYKQGSFQKKYIAKCDEIGKPLCYEQVNVLEKIIQDAFGVRFSEKEVLPTLMEEVIDVKKVSGRGIEIRTYNTLRAYVRGKGGKFVTNEDALEFYKGYTNPVTNNDYKVRGFGKTSLRDLRRYLESKKIIEVK